jgi:hypothetical protein
MSSFAVNRVVVTAWLALALGWTGTAYAEKPKAEAGVVASLYRDFGWQAFASQQNLFGDDLAHQKKATLEKYFAPDLAELLVRDAVCQVRSQGICNLDFELLFDSQDPRVTDLDVQTVALGKVAVSFKDPVNDETTKIEFNLAQVAGKWKIADVIYRRNGESSLKKVLSHKAR